MTYTQNFTTVTSTPTVSVGQLWKDTELNITYRTLLRSGDEWLVRCISDDTGKVWEDSMPTECFATELTLVN